MVTNEELFRKVMRVSREVRMKRFQPQGGPGCGMPPMPGMPSMNGMPGMPPMDKMPTIPGMGPMPGMPPMHGMPPMPPHCGKGPHKGHGPCGRHGHGVSRERLLVLLAEHPEGMWQKDLAWEADINASSASEMIGRLEADGLLLREPDENDRRAVLLKLTETGAQRAAELKAEREGFLDGLFSRLSDEEKQTLSDLLDKLLNE